MVGQMVELKAELSADWSADLWELKAEQSVGYWACYLTGQQWVVQLDMKWVISCSSCFPLLGKTRRTVAPAFRQRRYAAYRLVRWHFLSKCCMCQAVANCYNYHSSKLLDQRTGH